ncbi:MAG: multiheme c-type cytochrome [Bacteroidota bacterium]
MKRLGSTLAGAMCAGVLALGFWGIASAEETTAAAAAPAPAKHQYVGDKKCKMCHNSEKGGAQFTKWSESKHAKAFETLAGDKAKEIAKAKGIADPQKDAQCLSCHQTGYGEAADQFGAAFVATDGVQCESCHGAGGDYIKMKTMAGIRDKSLKAEDYGLIMPTEDGCKKCHNDKSPTFKSFDFKEYSEKIAHKIPEGFKRGGAAEAEAK